MYSDGVTFRTAQKCKLSKLLCGGCTLVLGCICRDERTSSNVSPCLLGCIERWGLLQFAALCSKLAAQSPVSAYHLTEGELGV